MKKYILLFVFLNFAIRVFSLNEAGSLLDSGINQYNNGQYAFAINNLKKYIQISSDNTEKPKAYYYIILSYYFLKDYSTSLLYINELSTKYRMSSYTASAYFWKGLIYQNQAQWFDAEVAFLKFIEMMPQSSLIERAYLALANSQIAEQKYTAAESSLKYLIDNFSEGEKYEEASVLYSYTLLQEEKYEEAKMFLSSWINKLGNNGGQYQFKDRFWLYMAEIELKSNNLENAKFLLKKIDNYAKNSPSSDIALLRLSQIEGRLDNDKESKEYLVRLANEYPASEYNIDSIIGLALLNYYAGDYESALTLFSETIKIATKKLQDLEKYSKKDRDRFRSLLTNSYYYSAESYERLNQKKKAYEYFEKVINENGALKNEAIIRTIELQLDEKYKTNLNKIIQKYDSILVNDKKIKDKYLLYKANIEYYNQNYSKALQILDSIDDKNINIYSYSILKANTFVKLNRIKEAIDILTNSQTVIPLSRKAFASYEISSLYFVIEDYDNVIKYATDSKNFAKQLPDNDKKIINIKCDYLIALSYMQLKVNAKSIDILRGIISNDPKMFDQNILLIFDKCFYYLGWLYYRESDFKNAADYFYQAKNKNIEVDLVKESYFMEAWSYYSRKNYGDALKRFEEVYKKYYPENLGVQSLFLMGKCYQNLGNNKSALDIYSMMLEDKKITSFKDQALYEIIKYNINKFGLDYASIQIERFKKSFPDSTLYKDVLILQAESLLELERFSEAYSLYNYCIERFKSSKDIDSLYYWGGYAAYKIKDYPDAVSLLFTLTINYPDSTFYINAMYLLADIYKEQKDFLSERDVINKILLVENNISKKRQFQDRLKVLDLINQGVSEDEAVLINRADNGSIDDKYNLALFYFNGSNKDKGIAMLKNIADNDKGVTGSRALMALADDKMLYNLYNEAIDLCLNILIYKTTAEIKAEALYKTAYCYFKLNDIEAVKKVLVKLYNTYPDSSWIQKAKDLEAGIKE
jgi:tetratricopeptide (TPR) repeat protein